MYDEWDLYFMGIAKEVSKNSKCFSRSIGSVIVKDKSIIATGYNGPPRGIPSCHLRAFGYPSFKDIYLESLLIEKKVEKPEEPTCPRKLLGFPSGQGLDICPASHSERSAIVEAARNGHCIKDSDMYCCCPVPCGPCAVEIINAGIKKVYITEMFFYDEMSKYLFDKSNVELVVVGWI